MGCASEVAWAYVPTNASWHNRIEAQITALRYFAVDGTDHASHTEQASMIRHCVAWRNRNAHDRRLGHVNRATLPDKALVCLDRAVSALAAGERGSHCEGRTLPIPGR